MARRGPSAALARSEATRLLALTVVTDARRCRGDLAEGCAKALRGGATAVLLRDRDMPLREKRPLARRLRALTADAGALFLVHGDVALARATKADGVHFADVPFDAAAVRRALGPATLVGSSTHDVAGAMAAADAGADYVLFGSIWPTASHPGRRPAGPYLWREAARATSETIGRRFPVVGIGGVNASRVTGLRGSVPGPVAVIEAVLGASDPMEAAAALLGALAGRESGTTPRAKVAARRKAADERSLVAAFLAEMGRDRGSLLLGPGDDAAVVDVDGRALATATDVTVAGVHYDASAAARQVGGKAVGRVLSDLAAVGARPRWVLLGLTLPRGTSRARALDLFRGAAAAARAAGARIVAGDTKETPGVETLAVTALGTVAGAPPLSRAGALVGDRLLVTGPLGGSLLRGRHLRPRPKWEAGEILRRSGLANSCIDLSDGLASDLRRLCAASRCGALLDGPSVPLHGDLRGVAGDPLEAALQDGEDFELLFSSPPAKARALLRRGLAGAPVHDVGRVLPAAAGLVLVQGNAPPSRPRDAGWVHLADRP